MTGATRKTFNKMGLSFMRLQAYYGDAAHILPIIVAGQGGKGRAGGPGEGRARQACAGWSLCLSM